MFNLINLVLGCICWLYFSVSSYYTETSQDFDIHFHRFICISLFYIFACLAEDRFEKYKGSKKGSK